MSTELTAYNKLRADLAEAKTVDEVKAVYVAVSGLEQAAKRIKDETLLRKAMVFRLECERSIGIMIRSGQESGDIASRGGDRKSKFAKKTLILEEVGIDKNLLHKAHKARDMTNDQIKEKVEEKLSPKPRKQKASKFSKAEQTAIARAYLDENLTRDEVTDKFGVSNGMVQRFVEAERAYRESEPKIDPATLSVSAQDKLQSIIKREVRKLEAEFEGRVQNAIKDALNDTVLPHYNKKMEEYNQVIKARRGVMDRTTYKLILACLHPDQSHSPDRLIRAFNEFSKYELALCSEKEKETSGNPLPKTYQEMMAKREEIRAQRRKYKGHSNISPKLS